MRSVVLAQWTFLLMVVAVASASGGCSHTQNPERRVYVISEDASGVGSNLESGTGGAGAEAYCRELEKQCFKKCWRRKPKHPSIEKHSGNHHQHCASECLKVFMQCVKEQEELERQESQKKALHFPNIGAALDWIKEHKAEVALGTIVIIGGLAAAPYAVAILGGALVLAPL
ncbi:hypothetical protein [Archangium violaceum]|uniref:hypothetical protein n=1 Tax=Archangium violaceum TaxID=83451 RepID=UPI0036D7D6BE